MANKAWLKDGKVLVNGDGHVILCEECPCEPPPVNTCNSCSPPIPDTLYVSFTDVGGTFAAYNGKHTIAWVSGCAWRKLLGTWGVIELMYDEGGHSYGGPPGTYWYCLLWNKSIFAPCMIVFCGSTGACSVTASYTQCHCYDGYCADTASCENSVNATCVVSLN